MGGDDDAVISFEAEQRGDEVIGGLVVQGRCGLIEQEHSRVEGEGPCDRQTRALSTADACPAFPEHRARSGTVPQAGQIEADSAAQLVDSGLADAGADRLEVLLESAATEERLLGAVLNDAVPGLGTSDDGGETGDSDAALRRVVGSGDQAEESRLPASGRADDGNDLSTAGGEADRVKKYGAARPGGNRVVGLPNQQRSAVGDVDRCRGSLVPLLLRLKEVTHARQRRP